MALGPSPLPGVPLPARGAGLACQGSALCGGGHARPSGEVGRGGPGGPAGDWIRWRGLRPVHRVSSLLPPQVRHEAVRLRCAAGAGGLPEQKPREPGPRLARRAGRRLPSAPAELLGPQPGRCEPSTRSGPLGGRPRGRPGPGARRRPGGADLKGAQACPLRAFLWGRAAPGRPFWVCEGPGVAFSQTAKVLLQPWRPLRAEEVEARPGAPAGARARAGKGRAGCGVLAPDRSAGPPGGSRDAGPWDVNVLVLLVLSRFH